VVLRLNDKDFLRLRDARGVAIEVLDGRVWITEDGREADSFLAAGGRYRVSGDGLVLIGAERDETALRLPA
jgi:ferric-dicitrate binding protein FerR (iron transport regulator)